MRGNAAGASGTASLAGAASHALSPVAANGGNSSADAISL
jgi:hypothetical protein